MALPFLSESGLLYVEPWRSSSSSVTFFSSFIDLTLGLFAMTLIFFLVFLDIAETDSDCVLSNPNQSLDEDYSFLFVLGVTWRDEDI